jgi:predicted permease
MLCKTPGFTVVAVLSLALGIGLNTASFSILNVLLIRPVPVVGEQDRLVWLRAPISYPDYVDFQNQTTSFEGMAAATGTSEFSLAAGAEPELIKGEYVTANYFAVLKTGALLGRTFAPGEGQTPVPVVVLAEHLWRTRFASDQTIIGRQIALNGLNFTVVGVAPANFIGTEVGLNRELWVPLAMQPVLNPPAASKAADPIERVPERDRHWLAVFARLKAGVSRERAGAELTTVARHVAETYQGEASAETLRSVELLRMSGGMDPRDQAEALPLAAIVMAVVALVLLIACANIASLLLARAAGRRRETAIRQALGATRTRLVRQWLTESILLGVAGGVLGLLLALWANQLLLSFLKTTPLAALDLGLDWRVLVFTLCISVATGIVFGMAPALQASRLDIVTALKSDDAQRAGTRSSRLRAAFVTAQLTLSVVLLIGAGLFIRSLQAANRIDPGFRVDRALLVPINLGLLRYQETEGKNFYRSLLARVESQPGVERASLVRFTQLGFSFAQFQVFKEGGRASQTDEGLSTGFNVVGPNYFATMETPLIRGRDFAETDRQGAPGVVVLNETLAARLWPGEDALGKRVSVSGPAGPFLQVVGIVRDGKYRSLAEPPHSYIYQPLLQSYDPSMTLVVRTKGEPQSVAAAVREQIRALEPNLPIAEMKTLRDQLDLSLFPSRLAAWTLGGFGVLALLLAAIGIYGVVNYSVTQRTREIGVRMALGATATDVLRLVLGEGFFVIGGGLVLGLLLAAVATRVIASFLYGVGTTDPLTFAGVPLLLALIALGAAAIPTVRATKVDPLVALRDE